jgi:hypothetical protein
MEFMHVLLQRPVRVPTPGPCPADQLSTFRRTFHQHPFFAKAVGCIFGLIRARMDVSA